MSAADCFEIGLYALKSTILTRSIQWLERAYRLVTFENDQTVSVDKVKQKLVEAIAQVIQTRHNSISFSLSFLFNFYNILN